MYISAAAQETADTQVSQNISQVGDTSHGQNEPQEAGQPVSEASNQAADVAKASKIASVAVYNGTVQKGLAKSISDKITAIPEIHITATGNSKGNFEKSIVVDLTGNNSEIAQKIADSIGASVGSLPDGEAGPENTDILIIGGSNYEK